MIDAETQEMNALTRLIDGDRIIPAPALRSTEENARIISAELLPAAQAAREHAVSYREFLVGAAVLGILLNGEDSYVKTGANIKPTKDGGINLHAEAIALDKLSLELTAAVPLIAVVGDVQPDQQSRKLLNTLHPCVDCRKKLCTHPLIDKFDTIIATATPDLKAVELSRFSNLRAFHENAAITHEQSGVVILTSKKGVSQAQLAEGLQRI